MGFSRPGAHIARYKLTSFEVTSKSPLSAVVGVGFSPTNSFCAISRRNGLYRHDRPVTLFDGVFAVT